MLAQDQKPFTQFDIGRVTLLPSGFFDQIAQFRTEPTGESISTHFGKFPITGGPSEWLTSSAHSRFQTKAWSDIADFRLIGYYEMDFQGTQIPYRTRQAFGEVQWGKWRVLGGRAWTLLRPNRWAMESDAGVWNTDVVEPLYHVGLVGFRKEQLRLSRYDEHWGAAVSLERRTEKTGTDVHFKVMRQFASDGKRYHLEAAGMAGAGRSAVMASAMVPIVRKLQFVTQEYYSHDAVSEALGVVPAGLSGGSFIQGLEARPTKNLELYSYGGMVFADRSRNTNHHVREVSFGMQRFIPIAAWHGTARTGFQISHLSRDIWAGREGALTQVMLQLRYDLP